jgi:PAS domain S-box-containing protein
LSPSYNRIWGRPAEDIYRDHDRQLDAIHPEDRPHVSSTLKRWLVGEDEDRYEVEYRIIRPDDVTRWIHARGTLIRDQHGKAYRASGIAEDITDAKVSQEALNKAQTELAHVTRVTTLGEMTASIAHELNQPLAAVVSNASACVRWINANNLEEARQSAARIIADGDRAGKIIGGIRALVNKAPPQRDWLDINETILEVIALARSEVQKHRVSLQTHLSRDLPLILGDRVQLQQVILNLINNAIEAISGAEDSPRALQVGSAKAEPPGVLVAVRDSGPGLDPASVDRLFTAFYTTKPQRHGFRTCDQPLDY